MIEINIRLMLRFLIGFLLLALIYSILPSSIVAASAGSVLTSNIETATLTPIKHLVIIYQENVAFDHYFATYPTAANPSGQPHFSALPNTPSINGLGSGLLTNNTNLVNPFRIDRANASIIASCDENHTYTAIQKSAFGGLMDKFVQASGNGTGNCNPNIVMGYFDGNTVTALWNYAQHFAMSDNFHSSNFDPSFPGHLNLISGQTHGATPINISGHVSNGTVIGDIDSSHDDCSNYKKPTISMDGKNVGNLLDDKNITWGWFSGGFRPPPNNTLALAEGKAVCNQTHANIAGKNVTDYVVHHEPFQYFNSTSNPHHLPPTSVAMIGHKDQANHQYDLSDFWNAAGAGNLPSVSFLKAPMYQTGHPGYSDPLDEQNFLVNTINGIQKLSEWNNTAIIIAYDDSGGWYDHVMPPIISQSNDRTYDALLGPNHLCGDLKQGGYQDRCGYGLRLPMLVISPYAKVNFVDHTLTDQSSISRFIEDNWHLGRIGNQSFDSLAGSIMNMFNFNGTTHTVEKLLLDPSTGIQNTTG